jgi:alpha-amylase/alpha-mannosidase (GH57 family)
VLGLEESPVFLEWLVDPSAEEVSGGNKRAKMTAKKSSCKKTQRELLNSLTGCLALLGSTVRPYTFI